MKDKFEPQIFRTNEYYDANDVRWLKKGAKEYIGFGWQSKKNGKIHITRCPNCGSENYALALYGVCVWCPFEQEGLPLPQ